ncbi:MAG: aliphatic sulfonate ABC transporter substrate-binding protein [Helicobacteraceae bacterium]|jgi:sulfonate transport system substrate-binding protein|nr:aliphatic sulfonate ABC transporter substrate-binding protein [Helicobacteraceae bacterium]
MKKLVFTFLTLAIFALGDHDHGSKAELRIGAQPYPLYAPIWAAKELGYLDEEFNKVGATYTWNVFGNGPLVNEGVRGGSIDLGMMADLPAIIARSVGLDIVVFANFGIGEKALALIAPIDSPIKEVKDIKGKKIAYGKGTYAQHLLALLVNNAGLKNSDFEHVNLAAGDIPAAIRTKQIDGAVIWEQYISLLVVPGEARVVADGTGIKLGNNISYIKRDFAAKHPEVLAAYIRAIERGSQYINGDNKAAAKLLSPTFKVTSDVLEKVFSHFEYYAKFLPRDIKEIETVKNYVLKEGLIKKDVDIKTFITTKYIEAAGI